MKKKKNMYNWINSKIFYTLILIFNITFINCACPNGEPFKISGVCSSNCNSNAIFDTTTCIPISTKEDDINTMLNIISNYYINDADTLTDKKIIEGEGINYIITTNLLENSNIASSFLILGNDNINKIKEVTISDFYIVLINILNTDYIASSKGIRIFIDNNGYYLLSNLLNKQTINIRVPVQVTNSEMSLYKQIKNDYGYDIFNKDDSFYTDKCTKFTSSHKTDMSLKRRNEVYGIYAKNVCSSSCTYQKFDET